MFAIVTIIMISSHSQIGVVDVSVTVFNDATQTIFYNSFSILESAALRSLRSALWRHTFALNTRQI